MLVRGEAGRRSELTTAYRYQSSLTLQQHWSFGKLAFKDEFETGVLLTKSNPWRPHRRSQPEGSGKTCKPHFLWVRIQQDMGMVNTRYTLTCV